MNDKTKEEEQAKENEDVNEDPVEQYVSGKPANELPEPSRKSRYAEFLAPENPRPPQKKEVDTEVYAKSLQDPVEQYVSGKPANQLPEPSRKIRYAEFLEPENPRPPQKKEVNTEVYAKSMQDMETKSKKTSSTSGGGFFSASADKNKTTDKTEENTNENSTGLNNG